MYREQSICLEDQQGVWRAIKTSRGPSLCLKPSQYSGVHQDIHSIVRLSGYETGKSHLIVFVKASVKATKAQAVSMASTHT